MVRSETIQTKEKKEVYECYKNCPGILKILLDENRQEPNLIKFLEKNFNVKMAVKNKGLGDKNVMHSQAKKEHRVILTNDQDFYNDHKFPMHETNGIIITHPQDTDRTIIALEKFLHTLDKKGYKLSRTCNLWWIGMKSKVNETEFTLKDINGEERFPYEP